MKECLPPSSGPENLTPEERFHVDPADFPLLSRQVDARGNLMDIDSIAEKYLTSTAELIASIDGTSEAEQGAADHIIYLDKSARPVSWLVNILWPSLSEQPRPPHSYLNIDRVNWFRRTGTEIDMAGNGHRNDGSFGRLAFADFDQSKITRKDLAGIRALFLDGGAYTEDIEQIMSSPTILDGKNLLIVDEVKNSGSTLSIAQLLFERAIPEIASVRGDYFWDSGGTKMVGDELQMGSVPVWYDQTTEYGRGIGDINTKYHDKVYEQHPGPRTLARKLGAFAIGAPLGVDVKARQLASEFNHLKEAYESGHVLLAPPRNYDHARAIATLNSQGFYQDATGRFSTYADFRQQRASQHQKNTRYH